MAAVQTVESGGACGWRFSHDHATNRSFSLVAAATTIHPAALRWSRPRSPISQTTRHCRRRATKRLKLPRTSPTTLRHRCFLRKKARKTGWRKSRCQFISTNPEPVRPLRRRRHRRPLPIVHRSINRVLPMAPIGPSIGQGGAPVYTAPRPYSPQRQPVFLRNATRPYNPQPAKPQTTTAPGSNGLIGPIGYDTE